MDEDQIVEAVKRAMWEAREDRVVEHHGEDARVLYDPANEEISVMARAAWDAAKAAVAGAEAVGNKDDWGSLYTFARDRLPDTYRALVNIDLEIAGIVRRGGSWSDDPRLIELGRNHNRIINALRVVAPLTAAPDQR